MRPERKVYSSNLSATPYSTSHSHQKELVDFILERICDSRLNDSVTGSVSFNSLDPIGLSLSVFAMRGKSRFLSLREKLDFHLNP